MTDMPEMGGMPSNDELVPFFTFEDIDHALENGEFCCYLQPKCNAETGTIVGAEALVRWKSPQIWRDSPRMVRPGIGKSRAYLPCGCVRMALRG